MKKKTKTPKQQDVSDRLLGMTQMMAKYFESKVQTQQSTQQASLPAPLPPQPRLKFYEMWANYEKMMHILDEDDVVDLNIELTNVIGAAVKRKRNKD